MWFGLRGTFVAIGVMYLITAGVANRFLLDHSLAAEEQPD
jgi:hypothetical protein